MEYVKNFPPLRLMPEVKIQMVIYKGDINDFFKRHNLTVQREFNLKGLCMFYEQTIYIMAEDADNLLASLLHETTHAVNMYLSLMGAECLDYNNDEVYARLSEWFQSQVISYYNGYQKENKRRKKLSHKKHI